MVKKQYKTLDLSYEMPSTTRVPYTLKDGTVVPSVTEVLSIIGSPDGLINWAVSLEKKNINWKHQRNHYADIGTTTHTFAERYLKTNKVSKMEDFGDDIKIISKAPILAFLAWMKDHTIVPHATEYRMVSEKHRTGGTADLIAYVDSSFEVIDFKTGAQSAKNKMQVAAYAMLARENGMKVTNARLVYFHRKYGIDGNPQFREDIIEEKELDRWFELFKAAKSIYKKI